MHYSTQHYILQHIMGFSAYGTKPEWLANLSCFTSKNLNLTRHAKRGNKRSITNSENHIILLPTRWKEYLGNQDKNFCYLRENSYFLHTSWCLESPVWRVFLELFYIWRFINGVCMNLTTFIRGSLYTVNVYPLPITEKIVVQGNIQTITHN